MIEEDAAMRQQADAITAVGIVTRGRPDSLCACLESYLQNCRDHERTPGFIVTDDSPDIQARSALERVRRHGGGSIFYAGRPERMRFAEALAQAAAVPLEV